MQNGGSTSAEHLASMPAKTSQIDNGEKLQSVRGGEDFAVGSELSMELTETKAMERRLPKIIRNRFKRLKYLLYAVLVLLLIPCVVEFCLRVSACRKTVADVDSEPMIEIVPSWTMHHQLKPLQSMTLPSLLAAATGDQGSNIDADSIDDSLAEQDSSDDQIVASEQKIRITGEVTFRTNSHGIRGPEIATPKERGVFRIVVVGDELTLAPHLREEDTFCNRLGQELKDRSQLRIEVINAAVPDFCPLLSYLQFRHQLASLEPDFVVLQLSPNDARDDGIKRRQTELGFGDIPLASINPQLLTTPKTKPLSEHFLSWKLAENSLAGWLTEKPRSNDEQVFVEASIGSPAIQRVSRQDVVLMLSPIDHMVEFAASTQSGFMLSLPPLTGDAWMRIEDDAATLNSESSSESKAKTVLEQILSFTESREFVVCNSTIKQPANDVTSYRSSKMSRAQHMFHAKRLADTITQRTTGPWLQRGN